MTAENQNPDTSNNRLWDAFQNMDTGTKVIAGIAGILILILLAVISLGLSGNNDETSGDKDDTATERVIEAENAADMEIKETESSVESEVTATESTEDEAVKATPEEITETTAEPLETAEAITEEMAETESVPTEVAEEVAETEEPAETMEVPAETAEATEPAETEESVEMMEMSVETVEATEPAEMEMAETEEPAKAEIAETEIVETEVAQIASVTPTLQPTYTPMPTYTFQPTYTRPPTFTPTPTLSFQEAVNTAVAATVTVMPTVPPAGSVSGSTAQITDYSILFAGEMSLSLVKPEAWTVVSQEHRVIIQSPEHNSGIIIERGSRAYLVSQGMLGKEADLSQALEYVLLEGQSGNVEPINDLPFDPAGVPVLALRAEDVSTITHAYLLTVNDDDYVLVLGYAPIEEAGQFEEQVMIPLLVSLDDSQGMDIAPATQVPATEAVPAESPTTEMPATQIEPTENPTVEAVPTEMPATEVAPTEAPSSQESNSDSTELPEGFLAYNSRGLKLSLQYPEDASLEQDGPLVLIEAAGGQARVVLIRQTPDYLESSRVITTTESPEAALRDILVENGAETPTVNEIELAGFPTYEAPIDFIPGLTATYYIVDMDSEWLFILTLVQEDSGTDYQQTFVEPIMASLTISPPTMEDTGPDIVLPNSYTSENTGVMVGVFEDTTITEGDADNQATFQFAATDDYPAAEITIYRGTPTEFMEQGLIFDDIGPVAALKSIAINLGIPEEEVAIEPDRNLIYDRSIYFIYENGENALIYLLATVDWEDWLLIVAQTETSTLEQFQNGLFEAFLQSLETE